MAYEFENIRINSNIRVGEVFQIRGMTDYYIYVVFRYHAKAWNGAIPLISKYQGIEIPFTYDDVVDWIKHCYVELDPAKNLVWQNQQRVFWDNKESYDTRAVFDALNGFDDMTSWKCRKCGPVPRCNPQPAARIKALKQNGYFIATAQMDCPTCGKKQFFDLLIRLPRQAANNERRFSISISLQNRIKKVLPLKDVCFDTILRSSEAVIDHKFPSSRWVNGETINETDMPDDKIKGKFQILTNQTNLQKERYCKRCVKTGKRGDFFGIKWYYEGDENWRGTSKADEQGCIGCCWYDMEEWKLRFNRYLSYNRNIEEGQDEDGNRRY